ncbi:MAG: adenosylcobinamide-GDP ribazoletransferase [Actinomycetota bacterium]
MRSLAAAFSFLTILGRGRQPDAAAAAWFGIVGAVLGVALGAVREGASEVWSVALVAAMVVVADLVLTGGLHLDGLADAGDGLLPHADRDRRLEIMRTPEVGAFGVAVVVAVLLVRFAALTSISVGLWTLVAPWAVARTAAGAAMRAVPYARAEGLAASFVEDSGPSFRITDALLVAAAFVLAGAVNGAIGVGAVFVALSTFATFLAFAIRRLGGFTGDVLGAGIMLAETAALVALAGSW